MAIWQVCKELMWTWSWTHVKGHQDATKLEHELDTWSAVPHYIMEIDIPRTPTGIICHALKLQLFKNIFNK
jgi:hypothetical protein